MREVKRDLSIYENDFSDKFKLRDKLQEIN